MTLKIFLLAGQSPPDASGSVLKRDVETLLFSIGVPAVARFGAYCFLPRFGGEKTLARTLEIVRPWFKDWLADVHHTERALVLGHSFGAIVGARLMAETRPAGAVIKLACPTHAPFYGRFLPPAPAWSSTIGSYSVTNAADPSCTSPSGSGDRRGCEGWDMTSINQPGVLDMLGYLRVREVQRLVARVACVDLDARARAFVRPRLAL